MDVCVHFPVVREIGGKMTHLLRVDARENRDRVLAAARELFAESGLEVTMRQVARRAGVGPATLYRRFPTKHDLVLEAFEHELAECSSIVYDGAADPDPWRGFCFVVERTLLLNARNQGFTDAFMSAHPDVVDFAAHREQLGRTVTTIIRRAQAAGRLRPDFVFDDFAVILLAGRGLTAAPASTRDAAVRRFAGFTIDGLRAAATEADIRSGNGRSPS
ncbi:TetR family transcriptional regulator [Actinocatenispora thailandica]|uniref:TetR family transcriptional regulator n=1 Tax=Actinocatenispora thailandica TaxID=227318 RepID=A0A7R7DLI4_9ACTN|nr:TetR/AcrR family transcriptional regulator [Actinocatenispora thailandica]BCJ33929.1 TetR family transcriptional regulator [Actinocatenispora thailandica]